ncbi:MAG: peptidoglycan editing factor PgeF [Chloroflexota bacterium]
MRLLSFQNLVSPRVAHGVSTRHGGVSEGVYGQLNLSASVGDEPERVAENRGRLAEALGFARDQLVTTPQEHGKHVMVVDQNNVDQALETRADAIITRTPGILLMQRFADCVPLLYWEPAANIVGVAHAGWRGTRLGVASATVAAITALGGSSAQVQVAIGPSIGPCCFEVGSDVAGEFAATPSSVSVGPAGRPHVDLWGANQQYLVAAGVPLANIEVARVCTRCNQDDYFSHRVLGYPAGRFGAAIGIRTGVDA